MSKQMMSVVLMLMTGMLAMPVAQAAEVGQEIRAQGKAALAEIHGDLMSGFGSLQNPGNDANVVRAPVEPSTAIRRQGQDALTTIAWEIGTSVKSSTLLAANHAPVQRSGYVTLRVNHYGDVEVGTGESE